MSEVAMQAPGLSQGERMIDTFVAPSKTFQDIFRSRSWWLPFLFSCMVAYAFFFVVSQKVGLEQVVQHSIEQRAEKTGRSIPPEQQATALKTGTTITKTIFLLSPVMALFFLLLTSLLLWLGFNFILGGKAEFTRLFTMAAYANLVGSLKMVLAAITIWFGVNDNLDINNPAGTNPGYFMGSDSAAWLTSLMTSLDITMIWTVILLGLGGAILANVKPRNGISMTLAVWFLVAIIKVAFAAMV